MNRQRARGVATVEAVIMLPALLVLLVGVKFTADCALKRHAALDQARSCAFQFALSGCKTVPRGCENSVGALNASGASGKTDDIQRTLDSGSSSLGGLTSIPILGSALKGLLGSVSAVTVTDTLRTPALILKNGTSQISERVSFPCNEMPSTENAASEVFDLLVKGKF